VVAVPAVIAAASDTTGPNTATVLGFEGRIAIDSFWYKPTTFRVYDGKGDVAEEFEQTGTCLNSCLSRRTAAGTRPRMRRKLRFM